MSESLLNLSLRSKPKEVKPPTSDNPPKWYSSPENPVVEIKSDLLLGKQKGSGGGLISTVYEGRVEGETCAIKIVTLETKGSPLAGRDLLREEYNLLIRLNKLAQDHTEKTGEPSFYFPRARLGELENSETPVLVMEWLPDDLGLSEYLKKIREELPGEYEAAYLEALRQAVEMSSILNQAGVQQVDRKMLDFHWKDGRLKVIDWNVQQTDGIKIADDNDVLHSNNLWQVQKNFFEVATSTYMNASPPEAFLQSVKNLAAAKNLSLGTKILLLSLSKYESSQVPHLSITAIRQRVRQLIDYTKMGDKAKEKLASGLCGTNRDEAFVLADMIVDPKRKVRVKKIVTENGIYYSPLEKVIKAAQDAIVEAQQREAERLAALSPKEKELEFLVHAKQTALQKLRGDPSLRFSLPESALRMSHILMDESKITIFMHPSHYLNMGQYSFCKAVCKAAQDWNELPEAGRAYIAILREISHFLDFIVATGEVPFEKKLAFGFSDDRPEVTELLERAALGYLEPQGFSRLVQILDKHKIWNFDENLSKDHPEKTRWDRFRKGLRLVGELGVSPELAFPREPDELFLTPKWEIAALQNTLHLIDNKAHVLSGYPAVTEELRVNCSARMRGLILATSPISIR